MIDPYSVSDQPMETPGKETEQREPGRSDRFLFDKKVTALSRLSAVTISNRKKRADMKITVIVPTYNRPLALRLCLLSLAKQSVLPHEVLVADDGSASETREMVLEMQDQLKRVFPIKHVWH